MCNPHVIDRNWFYLDNRRAMVSLGPLTAQKSCPYSCAFCYVQDGFVTYAHKTIPDIMQYLIKYQNEYDIIYVSGDTDSFAEPRKKKGLELLREISCNLDCDLLFTTRTTFDQDDIESIKKTTQILKQHNNNLFACISISRFSNNLSYLEPPPIPTPRERIMTLKKLHETGAIVVLALRPFLPMVPLSDYIQILEMSSDFIDIALGETFYFTENGSISKRIFPNGIPDTVKAVLKKKEMDFNQNCINWLTWDSNFLELSIRNYCKERDIVFSMRSTDAIQQYYHRRSQ